MMKVGIIGVGGIAKTHMPGWAASPHAEAAAGADISEAALKQFGSAFGIQRLYTDPLELIADPEIDVVDICTPNNYHAPLAIAALDAGKHVICEKPLAPNPGQILEMIAARDRSGKVLMTAQHFRFRGISKAMKREIEAGVLGDVYHARSWMIRRGAVPTRPGFVMKAHSSGGPCIDIGVHILDLTLHLMGNPQPVSVTGMADARIAHQEGAFSVWGGALVPKEFDVEDYAVGFVRFAGGQTLVLEVSWMMHHPTQGEDMQMWLYGTRGGCHWPKGEIYTTNYATKQMYDITMKYSPDALEPHAQECVEFAQAIVEDKPSPVPAEQSLQVMSILDGIYRSTQSGREVRLDG